MSSATCHSHIFDHPVNRTLEDCIKAIAMFHRHVDTEAETKTITFLIFLLRLFVDARSSERAVATRFEIYTRLSLICRYAGRQHY